MKYTEAFAEALPAFDLKLQYHTQYLTKGLAFSVHMTLVSPNEVHAAHGGSVSSVREEKKLI